MTLLSDLDFLVAEASPGGTFSPTHQEAYDRLKDAISGKAVAYAHPNAIKGLAAGGEYATVIAPAFADKSQTVPLYAAPHIVASEQGEPSEALAGIIEFVRARANDNPVFAKGVAKVEIQRARDLIAAFDATLNSSTAAGAFRDDQSEAPSTKGRDGP